MGDLHELEGRVEGEEGEKGRRVRVRVRARERREKGGRNKR